LPFEAFSEEGLLAVSKWQANF